MKDMKDILGNLFKPASKRKAVDSVRQTGPHVRNDEDFMVGELRPWQKPNAGEKITTIEFVPADDGTPSIWVSVGNNLEKYYDDSTCAKRYCASPVTCVAVHKVGHTAHTWTGHADGSVRVHTGEMWGEVSMNCLRSGVATLHVSEGGRAFVGGDAGELCVLLYNAETSRLELRYTNPRMLPESPVAAITSNCDHVFMAGGRTEPVVALCTQTIGTGAYYALQCTPSPCKKYGFCSELALMWIEQGVAPKGGRKSKAGDGSPISGWRLISGHEKGQLVVWEVSHSQLVEKCVVGEVGSAVRGLSLFEDLGMLVAAHQDGYLTTWPVPFPQPQGAKRAALLGGHKIKAHRNEIIAARSQGRVVATASSWGSVRVWSAYELLRQAEEKGVVFRPMANPSVAHAADAQSQPQALAEAVPPLLRLLPPRSKDTDALSDLTDDMSTSSTPPAKVPGMGAPQQPLMALLPRPLLEAPQGLMAAGGAALLPMPVSPHTAHSDASSSSGVGVFSQLGGIDDMYSAQSDWIIEFAEIQLLEEIGAGAEGRVWRGRWNQTDVAVKVLNSRVGPHERSELQALMAEADKLWRLSRNPNVVRFCGMCLDKPCIVTEYYMYGSLYQILDKCRRGDAKFIKAMSWRKRLDMLHDIAAGMLFLHSRDCVHGDLRSPNLFVAQDFRIKVGDFGFAKLLGNVSHVPASRSTNPRWLAPEVMKEHKISKSTDVFSFAIIMWELLTWQQPYEEMHSAQVVLAAVMDRKRPVIPDDDRLPGSPGEGISDYKSLMVDCWNDDPMKRPTFKVVVAHITSLRDLQRAAQRSAAAAAPPTTKQATAAAAAPLQAPPPLTLEELHRPPSASPVPLSPGSGVPPWLMGKDMSRMLESTTSVSSGGGISLMLSPIGEQSTYNLSNKASGASLAHSGVTNMSFTASDSTGGSGDFGAAGIDPHWLAARAAGHMQVHGQGQGLLALPRASLADLAALGPRQSEDAAVTPSSISSRGTAVDAGCETPSSECHEPSCTRAALTHTLTPTLPRHSAPGSLSGSSVGSGEGHGEAAAEQARAGVSDPGVRQREPQGSTHAPLIEMDSSQGLFLSPFARSAITLTAGVAGPPGQRASEHGSSTLQSRLTRSPVGSGGDDHLHASTRSPVGSGGGEHLHTSTRSPLGSGGADDTHSSTWSPLGSGGADQLRAVGLGVDIGAAAVAAAGEVDDLVSMFQMLSPAFWQQLDLQGFDGGGGPEDGAEAPGSNPSGTAPPEPLALRGSSLHGMMAQAGCLEATPPVPCLSGAPAPLQGGQAGVADVDMSWQIGGGLQKLGQAAGATLLPPAGAGGAAGVQGGHGWKPRGGIVSVQAGGASGGSEMNSHVMGIAGGQEWAAVGRGQLVQQQAQWQSQGQCQSQQVHSHQHGAQQGLQSHQHGAQQGLQSHQHGAQQGLMQQQHYGLQQAQLQQQAQLDMQAQQQVQAQRQGSTAAYSPGMAATMTVGRAHGGPGALFAPAGQWNRLPSMGPGMIGHAPVCGQVGPRSQAGAGSMQATAGRAAGGAVQASVGQMNSGMQGAVSHMGGCGMHGVAGQVAGGQHGTGPVQGWGGQAAGVAPAWSAPHRADSPLSQQQAATSSFVPASTMMAGAASQGALSAAGSYMQVDSGPTSSNSWVPPPLPQPLSHPPGMPAVPLNHGPIIQGASISASVGRFPTAPPTAPPQLPRIDRQQQAPQWMQTFGAAPNGVLLQAHVPPSVPYNRSSSHMIQGRAVHAFGGAAAAPNSRTMPWQVQR